MRSDERILSPVWLASSGRWRLAVQQDGRRKYFYSSRPGRAGRAEAVAKARKWLDYGVEDLRIRVSTAAGEWIDELKRVTSQSHWRKYDQYRRLYIVPCIGGMRVADLADRHLQEVVFHAFDHAARGVRLSQKSLKNIRAALVNFVKFCRKQAYTCYHPDNIYLPFGAVARERRILQPDDLRRLFLSDLTTFRGAPVRDWFVHAYRFAVLTGLRPGELIGLEQPDVDGGICTVRRSVNCHGEITRGKNDNARRSFSLPPLAMAAIDAQRAQCIDAGVISPVVFCAPDGQRPREDYLLARWRRYCKYNCVTPCTLYELRHTWVSCNKSIPAALIKPVVGHGVDFDTFGAYGHALDGDADRLAELVEQNFRAILNGL